MKQEAKYRGPRGPWSAVANADAKFPDTCTRVNSVLVYGTAFSPTCWTDFFLPLPAAGPLRPKNTLLEKDRKIQFSRTMTWTTFFFVVIGFSSSLALSTRRIVKMRGGGAGSAGNAQAIKVYYGDMPFWRAECVRIALHIGDIPFEDVRDWAEGQKFATFGALPVMSVNGMVLSQTQAMATYVGKLAGLYPEDSWLAAKHDEAINGCTDVTGTIAGTMRIQDEKEKVKTRAARNTEALCACCISGAVCRRAR